MTPTVNLTVAVEKGLNDMISSQI